MMSSLSLLPLISPSFHPADVVSALAIVFVDLVDALVVVALEGLYVLL